MAAHLPLLFFPPCFLCRFYLSNLRCITISLSTNSHIYISSLDISVKIQIHTTICHLSSQCRYFRGIRNLTFPKGRHWSSSPPAPPFWRLPPHESKAMALPSARFSSHELEIRSWYLTPCCHLACTWSCPGDSAFEGQLPLSTSLSASSAECPWTLARTTVTLCFLLVLGPLLPQAYLYSVQIWIMKYWTKKYQILM